jgi:hypothetical protein
MAGGSPDSTMHASIRHFGSPAADLITDITPRKLAERLEGLAGCPARGELGIGRGRCAPITDITAMLRSWC